MLFLSSPVVVVVGAHDVMVATAEFFPTVAVEVVITTALGGGDPMTPWDTPVGGSVGLLGVGVDAMAAAASCSCW